jgi:hypothetical protein
MQTTLFLELAILSKKLKTTLIKAIYGTGIRLTILSIKTNEVIKTLKLTYKIKEIRFDINIC